jgi:hypothetical protein
MSETRVTQKYMTFIFFVPINGIDFLRRFGECWRCRVVDDIGVTLDLTAIKSLRAATAYLRADFSALGSIVAGA